MAEVLSPFSSSNDAASSIHTRPSDSKTYHAGMSASQNQQQTRLGQRPRNQWGTNVGASGYRSASGTPVATYAFKATPYLKNESRAVSTPTSPSPLPLSSENPSVANRQRYPAPSSVSTTSSSSSSNPPSLPTLQKEDSLLFSSFTLPTLTTSFDTNDFSSSFFDDKPSPAAAAVDSSKPGPDRYRRASRKFEPTATPQTSQIPQGLPKTQGFSGPASFSDFGTGKMGQFYYNPQKSSPITRKPISPSVKYPGEDTPSPSDESKDGYFSNVDRTDHTTRSGNRTNGASFGGERPGSKSSSAPQANPPTASDFPSLPLRNGRYDTRPSSAGSAGRPSSASPIEPSSPRSFASPDAVRRINNPSPLSRPVASGDPPGSPNGSVTQPASSMGSTSALSQSPAVAAMAALNASDRDANKGVKSRLRRAFSFGSTAEMKRASGEMEPAADRAKARQEQFSTELNEEQDAIAKQQEAAGLGNSIYSGQGGVFTGSTDNLSISSTASSASMMLRKMGKGAKKGARSIKGIFRPKSVTGVPAADAPATASVGQVSMVTVEAEREQAGINRESQDQVGGGVSAPRLDRISLDGGRPTNATPFLNGEPVDVASRDRKSILGGEQERAEVLAAVRRGILKRSGTSSPGGSPVTRPADSNEDHPSPPAIANLERRGSPVPSTSSSEGRRTGHRRTDSHVLDGDDYFGAVPRLPGNGSTRSLPGTPRGISRNISFSPRIMFHDVWSSTEYDRRGDIATCNRLTPMLAQQIKEELNTFKMEMEVHELSKPHTHFF